MSIRIDNFSFRSRYNIAAEMLSGISGSLIDIGGRDRQLERYLSGSIEYFSADRSGEHDFIIDLEEPLVFSDRQFDIVVALDVLEHLERIQSAFVELLRIARQAVVVSLPNMASYVHRKAFLLHGRLATDKYHLCDRLEADRHRWLPVAGEIVPFFEAVARGNDFSIGKIVGETEGGRPARLMNWLLLKMKVPMADMLTSRTICRMDRLR